MDKFPSYTPRWYTVNHCVSQKRNVSLEHIKNGFYFACTYCVHLSDPQTSPVCDIERLGCSVIVHENQITTRFFPLANMLCAYAINRWEKTFSAAHSMALELG